MINSISVYDGANESFYHSIMLGLCAVLLNKYRTKSNRESGYGRFDIVLIPVSKKDPGFIFEFKYAKSDNADLRELAGEALSQIEDRKYDTDLRASGIHEVRKTGIAFRGNNAAVIR